MNTNNVKTIRYILKSNSTQFEFNAIVEPHQLAGLDENASISRALELQEDLENYFQKLVKGEYNWEQIGVAKVSSYIKKFNKETRQTEIEVRGVYATGFPYVDIFVLYTPY